MSRVRSPSPASGTARRHTTPGRVLLCQVVQPVGPRTHLHPHLRLPFSARRRANELRVGLLFLPSYSPNLIERLWRFTKRRACYGKYHADFAGFRAAVESVLGGLTTTHAPAMASLMTLSFQEFGEVSLLAA